MAITCGMAIFIPERLGETSQSIVIDWPNACSGDPDADVCHSYLILKVQADEVAEPYLDAYRQTARLSHQTSSTGCHTSRSAGLVALIQ
jgi:hypothetical protein